MAVNITFFSEDVLCCCFFLYTVLLKKKLWVPVKTSSIFLANAKILLNIHFGHKKFICWPILKTFEKLDLELRKYFSHVKQTNVIK